MKIEKKEAPTVSDPVLEERAKELIENPIKSSTQTEALATVGDARIERVKKSNGQGDRLAIRAANGKFTRLVTAVAAKDARDAQNFLTEKVKDANGVEASRKQHLRQALFDGAIDAAKNPKGLGNAVKAFDSLNEDAALTQAKESLLQDTSNIKPPLTVVVVPMIGNMMHPDVVDASKQSESATKKKPSFADDPNIIDVEVISTNPAPERK